MLRAASCGCAALLLTLSASLAAGDAPAVPIPARLLFAELRSLDGAALASPASVAEYRVDLASQLLPSTTRLAVPLPGGARLELARDGFEARSGGFVWTGRQLGGDGSAVLTVHQGRVSGMLWTATKVYQLLPEADGLHRLAELDHDRFPPCAGTPVPADAATPAPWRAPAASLATPRLDVMVVYTAQARTVAGGQAAIETVIRNAVDITNTAYANSQIDAHMQLVHTAEVGYVHDGSFSNALNWLAADAGVAQLRTAEGADMVALIVNGGSSCGIGFVQRNPGPGFAGSAFQVTEISCAVGNLTFAHEFGHNQGCEHNPENGPAPGVASFPWSFGHWHNGSYRTVMSYSNPCTSCPRQPYFSNSQVSFNGLPTGILDQRENYRTINATAPIVEAFRPPALLSDGFESGDTSAWSAVGP